MREGEEGQGRTHLLDRRRLLETIGVDTAQELLAKFHRIEGLDAFIPVCLNVILGQGLVASFISTRSLSRSFVSIGRKIKDGNKDENKYSPPVTKSKGDAVRLKTCTRLNRRQGK